MPQSIFLARTEEQETFRRVLASLLSGGGNSESGPFLFLFHGEGGMGKTSLLKRFRQIVETHQPFEREFNVLFLDWETSRDNWPSLQVGHDNIRPETVLNVLHQKFVELNWARHFNDYRSTIATLNKLDAKIESELKSKPDNDLYVRLKKLGSKALATWIRQQSPEVSSLSTQETLEDAVSAAADGVTFGLDQVRDFLTTTLTPDEYELYGEPHVLLARTLGRGIASVAKQKPLIIFLDTFEIVDRLEVDYTLRHAIAASGGRVIWVIAGRANLADSTRRLRAYFRGYKQDFAEERIFARELSEFGLADVKKYFHEVAERRPLSNEDALAIAEFTLGIPFAVSEAAAIWEAGVDIREIIAPLSEAVAEISPHERVVNTLTERFLKHCVGPDEQDRRAIYALALQRRPSADLLRAMLGAQSLERELQSLHDRYSFIWIERMRLDEKLDSFLHDYLMADVRRKDPPLPELNSSAIEFLTRQLANRTKDLATMEERIDDEDIADLMADLIHHYFWLGEEQGWRYFIPRFLEALQYDRSWARSIIEIVGRFRLTFSKEAQRRFKILSAALPASSVFSYWRSETSGKMLDELELFATRKWFEGDGASERNAILLLLRGRWLASEGRHKAALEKYLEAERYLPDSANQLRKDVATAFRDTGWELGFTHSSPGFDANPSSEAELAYSKATFFGINDADTYRRLSKIQEALGKRDLARASVVRALNVNNADLQSLAWSGNLYALEGKYEEAIAEYRRALDIEPKTAYAHVGLGEVYSAQGKYEEAIAEYRRALDIEPKTPSSHQGIGNVYSRQGKYEEAIDEYTHALDITPNNPYPHTGLGNIYFLQGLYERAVAEFKLRLELGPRSSIAHGNLGNAYMRQGNLALAADQIQTAIHLQGDHYKSFFSLGVIRALQGEADEASTLLLRAYTIYNGKNLDDKFDRPVLAIAAGYPEDGIKEMERLLESSPYSFGSIDDALQLTELLMRFPEPPPGTQDLRAMLLAAKQAQTGADDAGSGV